MQLNHNKRFSKSSKFHDWFVVNKAEINFWQQSQITEHIIYQGAMYKICTSITFIALQMKGKRICNTTETILRIYLNKSILKITERGFANNERKRKLESQNLKFVMFLRPS